MANRKHSKIDKLKPEFKADVEEMIVSGQFTYTEIAEYIYSNTGQTISLGAISKHAKRLAVTLNTLRMAQENFKVVMQELNKYPDLNSTDGIIQLMCGVWVCNDGTLYLACLGGSDYGDYAYCEDYSEIDHQGKAVITALVMTNSETGAVYSFGGTENGTVVTIDSPFASQELGSAVWGRIENYVHTGWHCDKADITHDSTLKNMSSLIFRRADIEGDKLFATTAEFSADSTGIYFSGGAAPYNEWNYTEYLERQLSLKLELDKRNGNSAYTKNGINVFQNLNSGGSDVRKKATVVTAFKSEV